MITYTLKAPADRALSADKPNETVRLKAGLSASGTEMNGTKLHCFVQGINVWMDTKDGTLTQSGVDDDPPPVLVKYFMETQLTDMGDLIKITGPEDAVWNLTYNGEAIAISGGGGNPDQIQKVIVDRTDGQTTVNVDGDEFTKQ